MTSLHVQRITKLWKMLRQPFTLPPASLGYHECRWEHLDMDVLGCLLCGKIHACADGRCVSTVEVEDGVVCTLSGVLIRNKRFVDNEFMSHVQLTDSVPSHNVFDEETCSDDVRSVVHNLLCSEMSKTLHFRSVFLHMNRSRLKLKNAENIALACAELMGDCIHTLNLTHFNAAARKAMVKPVSKCIVKVVGTLVHNFRMPLKEGELKSVTVGMLYLMRKGVMFEDLTVLPALSELRGYLPSENMLAAFFDIKSRTITESENRVKFALRTATRERLFLFGFNTEERL